MPFKTGEEINDCCHLIRCRGGHLQDSVETIPPTFHGHLPCWAEMVVLERVEKSI